MYFFYLRPCVDLMKSFYLCDIIIITCFFVHRRFTKTKSHRNRVVAPARMYNYWHVNNGTTNQRVIFYYIFFYPKITKSVVCWLLFWLLDFFLFTFFSAPFFFSYLFLTFQSLLANKHNKEMSVFWLCFTSLWIFWIFFFVVIWSLAHKLQL